MKKILLMLTVLGGTVFGCFAQSSSSGSAKFSVGIDAGIPSGNVGTVYNFGIGGSVKAEVPVATDVLVTFTAGYQSFMVKDEFKAIGAESSDGYIPLKAGLKLYINQGFYAEGQVGVAIVTTGGSTTLFAYSPGIGYSFDGGFDAGVRYEAWSKNGGTLGQIALRVAYRF